MIADLIPYPEMKDSGVEWLGEVPEHWKVRRLKINVANVVDQTTHRSNGEAYVALEHVESWTGRIRDAGADITFDSQVKRFKSGDVLFGKLRPYLAKVARPDRSGICVGEFLVLRPQSCEQAAGYLEQFLRSKPIIDVINASTFGAKMPRADWIFVGNLDQLLPPLPEQNAIVRYLDHLDRRVRRLVRAKRKLIALLTEQKQAIIHRAVTRGLDPDVSLKDAGVEWLGEVPEHWSLTPNRSLFRIRKVLVGYRHTEYQLLSLTKKGVIVRDMTTGKGKFSDFWERSQEVRPGDIVFCLFDVDETPRTVGLSRHLGMISGDYTVMECADQLNGPFLECFYKAMDDRKLLSPLYTGLRKRISKPLLLAAKTPIPPPSEQTAIVEYIDTATAAIEAAISRAEREMELLNEYRTRLTADVVTGKLDARDASAALPEVDPLSTEDDLGHTLDVDATVELDDIPEEIEA